MKRLVWLVVAALMLVSADAAVFERFLSPDRPADRAIIRYVELERSGKASSNDLAELGVLLLDKGFPKDAERYLKKALRLDRKNYEAAYRLGLVFQRIGRERAAMRAYRRTLRYRPGHTYARFMLALAQERAGRRSAAINNYVYAYRHLPQLANPTFNPLVLTSRLQTEAGLLHFERVERMTTFRPTSIDPVAVVAMMRAFPEEPRAIPEPAESRPTPSPETPAEAVPEAGLAPVQPSRPPVPERRRRPNGPTDPPGVDPGMEPPEQPLPLPPLQRRLGDRSPEKPPE